MGEADVYFGYSIICSAFSVAESSAHLSLRESTIVSVVPHRIPQFFHGLVKATHCLYRPSKNKTSVLKVEYHWFEVKQIGLASMLTHIILSAVNASPLYFIAHQR